VRALGSWLAARRPVAPMSMDAWLESAHESGSVLSELTSAGGAALDHALAHPGRARDSAFHLLAADALITYACEAALDSDDPDAALSGIVAAVARR